MAHMHVPDGSGYSVANDGGRNRVLFIHPSYGTASGLEVEKAARLLALALDIPGGIDAAIQLLREVS